MRIGSYIAEGRESYGIAVTTDSGNGIVDLGRRMGERYPDLMEVLSALALDEADAAAAGQSPDYGFDDVTYLPLFSEPGLILGVGANYVDHAQEMGHEKREFPAGFRKMAQAMVGHDRAIVKPLVSDAFDYEAEMAVVMGRGGRHIPAERWREYVAGYTCFMDGSVRDFQKRSVDQGKNFNRSSSMGPWLVTADEAPEDFAEMTVTGRRNGEVVQSSHAGMLAFGVPELIAYFSRIWEFAPGDVIATGSPAGVAAGMDPPNWLRAGDVFEVEIGGVGVLRNHVVEE